MTHTNRAVVLAGAVFLCTSSLVSPVHAEWQCPYFNGAYYPSVVSCPNWQWDSNGPQARAQAAQAEAAAARAEAAAAAQAREQARAEARAEQNAIRAAKAAADEQAMAENSPNNLCRDPVVARQLITDFNNLATWHQPLLISNISPRMSVGLPNAAATEFLC